MSIKLSKAGKMPCRSWSLQALDTCPASKNKDGSLVDACKGCYATDGNYNFKNVKAPRAHNKDDWKRSDWVSDMVKTLDNDRYFRWFDSGDMYSLELANKIYQVMARTPWVKHWLPTRMHKFAKFQDVILGMSRLDNVVVRLSSDSIQGDTLEYPLVTTTSTIYSDASQLDNGVVECASQYQEGKCNDCRACWNKEVKTVAYRVHGRKMAKQVKLIAVV